MIGSIYNAALDPSRWTDVLNDVSAALHAESAALHVQDQATGKGWGITANVDSTAGPLYFGYFATRNPIRGPRNDLLRLRRDSTEWRSRVFHDEHVLPKSELMRSEYYGDFLKRFDMHSLLMMGLAVDSSRFASVSFIRPGRQEQFGNEEIELASGLQSHLIRSFELSLKFSNVQRESGGFADFVNRSPNAVFLVDGTGYVRHLNVAAEALIAARAGLVISKGLLAGNSGRETNKLSQAIAIAAGLGARDRGGASLALFRADRRPLPVTVCPVQDDPLPGFPVEPLVLVCASDPGRGRPVPAERLQQLYGLTPSEAKVAIELSLGFEPRVVAERLSLSIHTVRFQLARIFAKTRTSRQAELVQLLDQVCSLCLEPEMSR